MNLSPSIFELLVWIELHLMDSSTKFGLWSVVFDHLHTATTTTWIELGQLGCWNAVYGIRVLLYPWCLHSRSPLVQCSGEASDNNYAVLKGMAFVNLYRFWSPPERSTCIEKWRD